MEIERQAQEPAVLLGPMRRADAARYLREAHGIPCAPATFAKYAVRRRRPGLRRLGKFPIYARDDLDAWAKSRLSERISSTSELSRRQAETPY